MKATDSARLLIKRNGKAVQIYMGDYKTACERFEAWMEDLWDGWTLEIYGRHDKLVRSSETEEATHGTEKVNG